MNNYTKNYHFSDSLNHSIEGNKLWDILTITENNFYTFVKNNNIENEVIFITFFDSLACIKCYEFHIKYWLQLKFKTTLYCHSKNLFNLVKKDIIKVKPFLNDLQMNIKNKSIKIKFLNVLVNKNGRILYADFAQLNNFDRSKLFYSVVEKYFVKI